MKGIWIMENRNITFTTTLLALGLLAFSRTVQAACPSPNQGCAGGNTAAGQNALLSRSTGTYNTAIGIYSLLSLTDGTFCTGVGAGTLLANTADQNTATGAGALLSNTTGGSNTANGAFALFSNTEGGDNTAVGAAALNSNTTGAGNTANGVQALFSNTAGSSSTAVGVGALGNSTGNHNTALGFHAGINATNGGANVYIGSGMEGVAGEAVACYIRSIFGSTSANGIPVLINSSNKLGTTTSSKRFKEEIKPMKRASEVLLALKPVTFRYEKEIDPAGATQFGLVAEEVEKVNPDLVVRDQDGKPYNVRYDQVNAMLLNEFLKAHRKMEEQERKIQNQQATITELRSSVTRKQKEFQSGIAQQRTAIEALSAHLREQDSKIQRVSDQLEMSKPEPRLAVGKPSRLESDHGSHE